jgi:Phage integrase family
LGVITVHHLRHTTATLLKNLKVPARDAQLILGHSRLAVTLEIYTHEDREAQWEAWAGSGTFSAATRYRKHHELVSMAGVIGFVLDLRPVCFIRCS